jgi:hypothetical protein
MERKSEVMIDRSCTSSYEHRVIINSSVVRELLDTYQIMPLSFRPASLVISVNKL